MRDIGNASPTKLATGLEGTKSAGRPVRAGLILLALAVCALLAAQPSSAATVTVTSTANAGPGSLRAAIAESATTPMGETTYVRFADHVMGTIALESTITFTRNVEIVGPGSGKLTITSTTSPALRASSPTDPDPNVKISGLRFADSPGVVLYAMNTDLTVEDARFENITGSGPGGVIRGFTENAAGYRFTLRRITIRNSTNASAEQSVGALGFILGKPAHVLVEDSLFEGISGNVNGGAIAARVENALVYENPATVEVRRSTFFNNEANRGAAIYTIGTSARPLKLSVSNSTFVNNEVTTNGGAVTAVNGSPDPGAVNAFDSSTFVGNKAGTNGGAIYSNAQNTTIVKNSAFHSNTADGDINDLWQSGAGGFTLSHNLLGSFTGFTLDAAGSGPNLIGVAPGLEPLGDNGGLTPTMAPSPSSPLVDSGQSELATDQRGLPRPVAFLAPSIRLPGGNGADIGAVELQRQPDPDPPAPPTDPDKPGEPKPPSGGGDKQSPRAQRLVLGKFRLNRRTGTATLQVRVPAAGRVKLRGSRLIRPASRTTKRAVRFVMPIRPRARTLKQLRKRGSLQVKLRLQYRPNKGSSSSYRRMVRLRALSRK